MNIIEKQEKAPRRIICALTLIPTLTMVILLVVWRPLFLPYFFRYTRLIISEAMNYEQRLKENKLELAHKEWRMYQIESRFGQDWCEEKYLESRSDVTWLTIVVDENFASTALVLGHSIRTFSCQKNMIAFVSERVSEGTRKVLQSVGWNTRLVEEMDCDWLDAKLGGDRNSGWFARPRGYRIKGTHTRFHAWNYTEFSKIIYVDADYMLMTNIDRLFDIPDDFAAAPSSRPGVINPAFNAGFLVFRPDTKYYEEIMDLWLETTRIDTCPDYQVLLWHYYADAGNWKALPFSFNIRHIVYRPLNSFHFAGSTYYHPPKPWSAKCRPSRKEARDYDRPILVADDMMYIFWKILYELLKKYNLEDWWRSTKLFRPAQEFGIVPYSDCKENIEDD
ncbi:glycogenin-1-like [Oculina patagonica]